MSGAPVHSCGPFLGWGRACGAPWFFKILRKSLGRVSFCHVFLMPATDCGTTTVGTKARRTTFGLGTASDRLGTDATAHVSGRPPSVFLALPPSPKAKRAQCARRHRASTPVRGAAWAERTPSCGSRRERFASQRAGGESMCRLMCHCVRHVSLDNKYGRTHFFFESAGLAGDFFVRQADSRQRAADVRGAPAQPPLFAGQASSSPR